MAEQGSWILCLSGLDPSGASGLHRDLWALGRAGLKARGLPTCLTSQSRTSFGSLRPLPPGWLSEALAFLLEESRPAAVKVGLVGDPETWEVLLPFLEGFRAGGLPLVVDPIRSPSAGGFEAGEDLGQLLRRRVLPLGPFPTPNLPELSWLTGREDPEEGGRILLGLGASGVLVTGGHAGGSREEIEDLWISGEGTLSFGRARKPGPGRRGTGCVLSSLLAGELSLGRSPAEAAEASGRRLQELWEELEPLP